MCTFLLILNPKPILLFCMIWPHYLILNILSEFVTIYKIENLKSKVVHRSRSYRKTLMNNISKIIVSDHTFGNHTFRHVHRLCCTKPVLHFEITVVSSVSVFPCVSVSCVCGVKLVNVFLSWLMFYVFAAFVGIQRICCQIDEYAFLICWCWCC